jgi:hypothetical protein
MRYRWLLVLALVSMSLLPFQSAAGQACGLDYELLTNSGTLYGLVGLPNQISLFNQTFITVTGKLRPYNASQYLHPTPNYGGTIDVLLLQSQSTTESLYSLTMVIVEESSGTTWTYTTTQPNNPLPAKQSVTLSGLLIETYGQCVQPLQAYSISPTTLIGVGFIFIIAIAALSQKRHK